VIVAAEQWRARQQAHHDAVDERTTAHLTRRRRQEKHPVYDFLFEYYPVRPAHLRRWHPGADVWLDDPEERAVHNGWRDYTRRGATVGVDVAGFLARRGAAIDYIEHLLGSTTDNPANFDCFGLHEWAMCYRGGALRHDLPLRLGRAGTDAVVDAHQLKCTHYDAYRFFTAPARPLNLTVLHREEQPRNDQPGCVHATMDLYKWAAKLAPLVPSEVWLETFDLAMDARVLDMEASPYDCRGVGFGVVAIETPEGKAEYVRRQRRLAERAGRLRARLVALIQAARRVKLPANTD
jgi:hypothetical protein